MNKERILNAFFMTNSVNSLCEEVSDEFNCPIIITDSAFHIVTSYSASDYKDGAYRRAVMHSELSLESSEKITDKFRNCKASHIWIDSENNRYCVGSLLCNNSLQGYILYIFKWDEENIPTDEDLCFCEGFLAKQLFFESRASNNIPDTSEQILINLIEGKFSDEEKFRLRVSGTYLSHFNPKRIALLSLGENSEKSVTDRIITELSELFHASHPFIYKEKIIMFFHADHHIHTLFSITEKYNLKAVISSVCKSLYSLEEKYHALDSVLIYLEEKGKSYLCEAEENYSFLGSIKKLSRGFLMPEEIEKLYISDTENNTELCKTLFYYLSSNHSLKKTSELLFTHSNTIFYRITRMKELYNIDTEDFSKHFLYLSALSVSLLKLGEDEIFIGHKKF